MYVDKEFWDGDWVDLYDSNHKLWKSIAYFNDIVRCRVWAAPGTV
jgi:hypothetical protein